MSTGTKILIVFGGVSVLLILIAFIAYPIFRSEPETPSVTQTQNPQPVELTPLPSDQERAIQTTDSFAVAPDNIVVSEASQRAEVERISRYFVERFGSYSNFSGFENIRSLDGFMTDTMKQYAESVIEASEQQTAGYYGVTTRIVGLQLAEFVSNTRARVTIVVQQEIQDGLNADIVTQPKDGYLELIYSNGAWLVNGLYYR